MDDVPVLAAPAAPYRGIQPFRYADHAIFFAREEETRLLTSLVAVYRGVFLYGDSGNGKSSLINAGLLPEARQLGYAPVRVRVQPRAGEELVIEQIATSDEDSDGGGDGDGDGDVLPCVLAPETDGGGSRVVLSIEQFHQRVHTASQKQRPLIIFDQFEELVTLFDAHDAAASRRELVAMILALLREELPVKVLFAFREDYLAKIKRLLAARPELVDQELRLGPPSAGALAGIIRGPFERFPGRYDHELDAPLAQRLSAALAERFGTGEVSLSEVQTVCLRLYNAPDPHALLADKGIQGLLEDDLGEALQSFPGAQRDTAIALLSQMITDAGTRNVISAQDLRQRIADTDDHTAPELLDDTLERLERDSKLVRRERRRDIYLYEITSEFLVPWISQRRQELQLTQQRQHERRRLRILTTITTGLLIIAALITALAIWALGQRSHAQRQTTQARSLALASSASSLLGTRPDVSLLLADEAYRLSRRVEAPSSMLAALTTARDPGLLAILHGHSDAVYGVAVSPDGHTLATASDDKTIRLWDTRTHKQLGAPLTGHTDAIYSVAFSPDGRTLASASKDKTIRLWDARTHTQLGTPLTGHTDIVGSVAFSPDGHTLASASDDKTIRLWDVRTHKQLAKLTGHADAVLSVAFSPDGHTLASAGGNPQVSDGGDKTIRLWDTRTHKQLAELTGHKSPVESVAFSPDGRTLASAGGNPLDPDGGDKTIRLWDTRTHKQLAKLTGHTDAIESIAFSLDGRTLASASDDHTIRLWDVRTHKPLGEPLRGHTDVIWSVAFNPDGRTLASASSDQTIRLWDPRAQQRLGEPLRGHTDVVWRAVFSPDGHTLASSSVDNTVRLWDVRTHKQLGELTGHKGPVQSVVFSPDGRTLASVGGDPSVPGGGDTTIRLWDARTHKQIGEPLRGHTDVVWSVAFSRDGRMLASSSADKTVRLWDVRTHKQIGKPLRGHRDVVFSVAFSRNGRTLASAGGDPSVPGGGDTTIRLWDARTHKQIGEPLRGHTDVVWGVAFSPDGRTLASASADKTIELWDVRTHKQLGPPLTGHTDVVQSVAFSPDGKTLASASRDQTIRLWDTGTHKQLGKPLKGQTALVLSVAFSPDGRTLASTDDTTVRLWEGLLWRNAAELRTTVCKLVGSGLSRTEWAQYAAGIPYHQTCP